jgi:hypothetical protein
MNITKAREEIPNSRWPRIGQSFPNAKDAKDAKGGIVV